MTILYLRKQIICYFLTNRRKFWNNFIKKRNTKLIDDLDNGSVHNYFKIVHDSINCLLALLIFILLDVEYYPNDEINK